MIVRLVAMGLVALVTSSCRQAQIVATNDASVPMRCADPVVPLADACALATHECLVTCATEDAACQSACLDADPDPASCNQCLDTNELACYLEQGCARQWDALSCCPQLDDCTEREDFAACVESSCPREWDLFRGCSSFVEARTCEPLVRTCFGL